jgi:hypothetical protein
LPFGKGAHERRAHRVGLRLGVFSAFEKLKPQRRTPLSCRSMFTGVPMMRIRLPSSSRMKRLGKAACVAAVSAGRP